jgi:hypothetical protein
LVLKRLLLALKCLLLVQARLLFLVTETSTFDGADRDDFSADPVVVLGGAGQLRALRRRQPSLLRLGAALPLRSLSFPIKILILLLQDSKQSVTVLVISY